MEQEEEVNQRERYGLPKEVDQDEGSKSTAAEPDVVLDVPKLKVEEIELKVQDAIAKISLSSNIINLTQINAGTQVKLKAVKMTVKGVEAEAQLKVRLQRVKDIVNRTMESVDRNPELIKGLKRPIGEGDEETARRPNSKKD